MKTKSGVNWSAIHIISLFMIGFSLVMWTVYNASKLPVQLDQSFFETKKEIDDKFNNMLESNVVFNEKYDTKFVYNGVNEASLDVSEIFLSQTVIQERGTHRNFLKVGENTIEIFIKDKNSNIVPENVDIHTMVTIASNNTNDIDLTNFEFIDGRYISTFEVPRVANWNVNGIITIGEDKGYFLIKTNAK
ncbi:hypothetical protein [Arcobacter sp. FWKO B]|uniref:hypothetical protein n=1 Tax=Arcobacter sp. FWKO B TaxID=2593672 RepID=UPI0018A555DB|nr:hypothetical protein [Arcobacter sp. FWKO B]QOG12617.1 hypothetical protein FWKOB_07850 [Arcobacter sp. FWKO B]